MKQTVKNFYYRLIALYWLATRKRFYLFATNGKGSRTIETYNIDLKEFRIYFECRRNGFPLTLQGLIIEKIGGVCKGKRCFLAAPRRRKERHAGARGIGRLLAGSPQNGFIVS